MHVSATHNQEFMEFCSANDLASFLSMSKDSTNATPRPHSLVCCSFATNSSCECSLNLLCPSDNRVSPTLLNGFVVNVSLTSHAGYGHLLLYQHPLPSPSSLSAVSRPFQLETALYITRYCVSTQLEFLSKLIPSSNPYISIPTITCNIPLSQPFLTFPQCPPPSAPTTTPHTTTGPSSPSSTPR